MAPIWFSVPQRSFGLRFRLLTWGAVAVALTVTLPGKGQEAPSSSAQAAPAHRPEEIASTAMDAGLPDAPRADMSGQSAAPQNTPSPQNNKPSKRVLYIIPNYRAVGVGVQLPPQTVGNKLLTAFQDTVDPSSFALAAIIAGYDDVTSATPEFHTGGVAFGRYYWHALADQSIENMSVEFIVPALTHEDTRYYTLGTGGGKKRLVYALTRTFVVRSDSGKETANLGEIVGAGMAAAIASRYYPPSQKTASSVVDQYVLDLGIDAASYVLREFDADLGQVIGRRHQQVETVSTP